MQYNHNFFFFFWKYFENVLRYIYKSRVSMRVKAAGKTVILVILPTTDLNWVHAV